jgi:hypothetical protein
MQGAAALLDAAADVNAMERIAVLQHAAVY